MKRIAVLLIVLSILSVGCNLGSAINALVATETPTLTITPIPTNTPVPTNTPLPTRTPLPTITPTVSFETFIYNLGFVIYEDAVETVTYTNNDYMLMIIVFYETEDVVPQICIGSMIGNSFTPRQMSIVRNIVEFISLPQVMNWIESTLQTITCSSENSIDSFIDGHYIKVICNPALVAIYISIHSGESL
jgi:hypothetical protein